MAILHKFQEHDWKNGFKTENSILKSEFYLPEVLIIGTFNHGWSCNPSDFFYGRGMYMWPIMANLFLHNNIDHLTKVRNINNDLPQLSDIFEICKKGKISFADIVKGTKDEIQIIENNGYVRINDTYNWTDYKDSHLNYMGNMNWLDDNVEEIIDFINKTPSIKHVYFTFKTGGNWILKKKKGIFDNVNKPCSSIFTPTATGFRSNLPAPFNTRIKSLTHCWIWNNLNHAIEVNKEDYGYLNHDWLTESGVNVNEF